MDNVLKIALIWGLLYVCFCLVRDLAFSTDDGPITALTMAAIYLVTLLATVFVLWLMLLGLRKWRGYYVHQNAMGCDEDGSVEYHEGGRKIELYFMRPPFVLYVPTDEAWQRDMPDWASERKAEIMARIKNYYRRSKVRYEDTDRVHGVASADQTNKSEPPLFGSRKSEARNWKW